MELFHFADRYVVSHQPVQQIVREYESYGKKAKPAI